MLNSVEAKDNQNATGKKKLHVMQTCISGKDLQQPNC